MAKPTRKDQPGGGPAGASAAARPRQAWQRWIVPAVSLAVTIVAFVLLVGNLRRDTWSYFTDEQGLRAAVDEGRHRLVLWDDPKPVVFEHRSTSKPEPELKSDGADRLGHGRVEATFSPDGTAMMFAHRSQDGDAGKPHTDLFISTWNGRIWSKPAPLVGINSAFNERTAAYSADGRSLYFSSDRPGGAGGYDLYVAHATPAGWAGVQSLGASVNSAGNETGPAPAVDGSGLFFTSDRGAAAGIQDIYFARREAPAKTPQDLDVAFAEAQPVDGLNSSADDLKTSISQRGGSVFLASDRDRNGKSGFQVYLSRVVDGRVRPPEPVDVYVHQGNVTDPATRMDGFDLFFSTDAPLRAAPPVAVEADDAFGLYRSTTREVIGYVDLSRWEAFKALVDRVAWWVLLAVAALIGIIYLLEKWRDITSVFHKCLAGSIIAHLLVLFLMMSWLIAQQVNTGGQPQAPEVALSVDALAQEQLAMESEQELSQVADTARMVVTKNVADFKEVKFEATDVTADPVAIIRQSTPESLVSQPTPSVANESETTEPILRQDVARPAPSELTPTLLPELEVAELEVKTETDAPPVDLTSDDFRVDMEQLQKVESSKLALPKIESASIDIRSQPESVAAASASAATTDTGGKAVSPSSGLESEQPLPSLGGDAVAVALAANLPGSNPLDAIMNGPKLETPEHDLNPETLARLIRKQTGKPSVKVIEQLGGSEGTERAIGLGLDWLTNHQEPDGHWDMSKYGGAAQNDTAGAGLALLCYYGWGIKHGEYGAGKNPRYQKVATDALRWLIAQQKADGDLRGSESVHAMYCHGIATLALCEAFMLTEDPALKEPLTLAVQFIVDWQHEEGGWRYQRGQPGDLSVTGWQLMALRSASMAGIAVPEQTFKTAKKFIDSVAGGKHGGRYGYMRPSDGGAAMTPTGMFLRQLDLEPPDRPRMMESAEFMRANMLKPGRRDFYYEYYATLALYQHQGPIWEQWNTNLKETYLASQVATGEHAGSWDPGLDRTFATRGGRVTTTTLAILSLEVYYRLLPLYGFDRPEPDSK